jgi:hypothetical protein
VKIQNINKSFTNKQKKKRRGWGWGRGMVVIMQKGVTVVKGAFQVR